MIDGFLNLNKPAHWTSHDCVARVRRLLNTSKIGHGGTLDPLATGVLPIAIGRATRLLPYLAQRKAYRAVIRFGLTTTTDDLAGEVLTQRSAAQLEQSAVELALPQFVGNLSQLPPMYSAIQIRGKRLYDLARQGQSIEVPPRSVVIYQLSVQNWQPGEHPELTLTVDCGPGTYIRSLARDLGEVMGTGATLASLVRSHSNGFDLTESISLESLEQQISAQTFSPIAAGDVVKHLEAIALPAELARRWRMGQKLAVSELAGEVPCLQRADRLRSPLRIVDLVSGQFLGIGEIREVLPKADLVATDLVRPKDSPTSMLVPKMVFVPVD
jgi:tRNA pseudouridine55 synthase